MFLCTPIDLIMTRISFCTVPLYIPFHLSRLSFQCLLKFYGLLSTKWFLHVTTQCIPSWFPITCINSGRPIQTKSLISPMMILIPHCLRKVPTIASTSDTRSAICFPNLTKCLDHADLPSPRLVSISIPL